MSVMMKMIPSILIALILRRRARQILWISISDGRLWWVPPALSFLTTLWVLHHFFFAALPISNTLITIPQPPNGACLTSNATGEFTAGPCGSGDNTFGPVKRFFPVTWNPGQDMSENPIWMMYLTVPTKIESVQCVIYNPVGGDATLDVYASPAPSSVPLPQGFRINSIHCNANAMGAQALGVTLKELRAGDILGVVGLGKAWENSHGVGAIEVTVRQ